MLDYFVNPKHFSAGFLRNIDPKSKRLQTSQSFDNSYCSRMTPNIDNSHSKHKELFQNRLGLHSSSSRHNINNNMTHFSELKRKSPTSTDTHNLSSLIGQVYYNKQIQPIPMLLKLLLAANIGHKAERSDTPLLKQNHSESVINSKKDNSKMDNSKVTVETNHLKDKDIFGSVSIEVSIVFNNNCSKQEQSMNDCSSSKGSSQLRASKDLTSVLFDRQKCHKKGRPSSKKQNKRRREKSKHSENKPPIVTTSSTNIGLGVNDKCIMCGLNVVTIKDKECCHNRLNNFTATTLSCKSNSSQVNISFKSIDNSTGNTADHFKSLGGFAASFLITSSSDDHTDSEDDDWDNDWGETENCGFSGNEELLDLFRSPVCEPVKIKGQSDTSDDEMKEFISESEVSNEIIDANARWASCYSKMLKLPTTDLITQRVRFADTLHTEHVYNDANEDRKGPWMEMARDRERFKRRIQESEQALAAVLTHCHRKNIQSRNKHNV